MRRSRAYMDANATQPLHPAAREAMLRVFEEGALNASAQHAEGRRARAIVEKTRAQLARLLECDAQEIVFTSSGSEADNMAVKGADVRAHLVSPLEHPAMAHAARATGRPVVALKVDARGVLDLAGLEAALKEAPKPAQVCIMLASHETGALQPVREAVELAHAHDAIVHCDAVQAAGRALVSFRSLGVDTLAVSAHKFGGPQGVGALVVREGLAIEPLVHGGGQERRRRAGTENVAGIAGMAAALEAAVLEMDEKRKKLNHLRAVLEVGLRKVAPTVRIFSEEAERTPGVTLFAVPGLDADMAQIALDLEGFAVSRGAACASGKTEPSAALLAMGVPEVLARNALRVSLGDWNTEEEICGLLAALKKLLAQGHAAAEAAA